VAPGNIDATFVAPPPGQECLSAASGYSPTNIWNGPISWKLDAFNYAGLQLAQNACNSFPTECQAGRYFITVLPSGYDAWNGVSGASANIPSANTVWYVGSAPPFVDPWYASRYEVGHELMHAMGISHPGYWIDDTGANRTNLPVDSNGHTTGLCQEESPDTSKYYPTVAVNNSTLYSFNPGIERKYPAANWPSVGTYPNGRAYSLGPMVNGANHEIWGVNIDAFNANELPQRIVVDPHNTFDMMSYCFGTYGPPGPGGGASKFQWISVAEYKAVLSKLS
jgi:hypothetical protein